jgi:hypothetical protein
MPRNVIPKLAHRTLGPDNHARSALQRPLREDAATGAGRPDVHPEVTESHERAVMGHGEKAPKPAPGQILQEDALDRILGAEGKNLVERRRTRLRHLPILPRNAATKSRVGMRP